jgi:uncharacterized membrane protein YkvA (DUF1232 family)
MCCQSNTRYVREANVRKWPDPAVARLRAAGGYRAPPGRTQIRREMRLATQSGPYGTTAILPAGTRTEVHDLMTVSENIRKWARNVKRDGVTLWFACKHPNTSLMAKLLCVLVVAYALSPIDLIPDFIPVLGYLDDVILLPCLIWIAVRLVPANVLAECRTKAIEWMVQEGQKPRSNWGILFVALVWILVTWLLWKYLLSPYV